MNLDRTFCVGTKCPMKEKCERWTLNLEMWAQWRGVKLDKRPISITNFRERLRGDEECEAFTPLEKYVS